MDTRTAGRDRGAGRELAKTGGAVGFSAAIVGAAGFAFTVAVFAFLEGEASLWWPGFSFGVPPLVFLFIASSRRELPAVEYGFVGYA